MLGVRYLRKTLAGDVFPDLIVGLLQGRFDSFLRGAWANYDKAELVATVTETARVRLEFPYVPFGDRCHFAENDICPAVAEFGVQATEILNINFDVKRLQFRIAARCGSTC